MKKLSRYYNSTLTHSAIIVCFFQMGRTARDLASKIEIKDMFPVAGGKHNT